MSAVLSSVYDQLVKEAADKYQRRGFVVHVKPAKQDLPDFLQEFHPDIVVTTPEGERLVIHVKAPGKAHSLDYWKRLRDAVQSHPNWQDRIVVNNPREEELVNASKPLFTREEIEARLCAAQQFAEQGLPDSALIVGWAAVEALLHHRNEPETLRVATSSPAALVSISVSEGNIGYDDYDALTPILSSRNQAAHGRHPDNAQQAFKQLYEVAQRLLQEQKTELHGTELQAAA